MKVTVMMGVEKVMWVRADVELDDYDETHQGAIVTHALMSAGDQVLQQWRDIAASKTPTAE